VVLNARDIVEKDFISLTPETSALDAAKRMAHEGHGFVIVSDLAGDAIGIVTEWDFIAKIDGQDKDPGNVRLRDIMSSQLVSIDAGAGFDEVARLMASKGIRRLLVMDHGHLVGVVTARRVIEKLNEYVTKISVQIARLQSLPF
jgi:CBS domain-containing protein